MVCSSSSRIVTSNPHSYRTFHHTHTHTHSSTWYVYHYHLIQPLYGHCVYYSTVQWDRNLLVWSISLMFSISKHDCYCSNSDVFTPVSFSDSSLSSSLPKLFINISVLALIDFNITALFHPFIFFSLFFFLNVCQMSPRYTHTHTRARRFVSLTSEDKTVTYFYLLNTFNIN